MILNILVVVLGLCLFEVISSVDNAVVNAHVLKTMPEKYRKIFLFWGLICSRNSVWKVATRASSIILLLGGKSWKYGVRIF